MSRGTMRLMAAAGLSVAALVSCALAFGASGQAKKLELGAELGKPDRVIVYDNSRLLLLRTWSAEEPTAIMRVNADGSLDRSFGDGGRLEMQFSDVIVAPDGRILVSGSGSSPTAPSDSDAQVTRLLPNGSLDPSFGKGGTARVDLGGRYDGAATLMLAADGKVVIGGTKQTRAWERGGSDAKPALARFLPNGAVDRSFARRGVRLLPGGWEGGVYDVVPAPHGGIVAEGEAYLGTEIWKLKPSGQMDRHFGKHGVVTLEGRGRRLRHEWEEEITTLPEIGVLPNGKVVLAGTGSRYGMKPIYRVLVVRLRADGRIDRSYGRHGWAAAGFRGSTFAQSSAFLPDGRLIVAADAQVPDGKRSDLGVIVFRGDGGLDRGFGNHGKARVNLRGWDLADDVTVQGNRVVVLGEPGKQDTRWLVGVPLSAQR